MLRPDLFGDPESHEHELEQFISGLPGDRIAASALVDEIRKLEKKDKLKNGGFTEKYGSSLLEFFTYTSTRDKWKFEILLEMFIPLAEELALGFSQTMQVEQGVITDPEILTQIAIDALMQGINDYEPIDDGVSLLHFYIFLKDKMSEALLKDWGTAQREYDTTPLQPVMIPTKDEEQIDQEPNLDIADITPYPEQNVDPYDPNLLDKAITDAFKHLTARDIVIITNHFNEDNALSGEPLNKEEIAKLVGTKPEYVRRILNDALKKLRRKDVSKRIMLTLLDLD